MLGTRPSVRHHVNFQYEIAKRKYETLLAKEMCIRDRAMIKVRVGYGNPTDVLPKIAESYQEAKMALEVGRLFYGEKDIALYRRRRRKSRLRSRN